ncbi:MAG: hypothetical protein AABN95_02655 [Acidobacteriota bacterium]
MSTILQLRRVAGRTLSIGILVLLVVVTASAYTIVLRDGRRLEIPSSFVVTPSTLTYEVKAGIQITLQMSAIDVQATEKANGEAAGALLRRAQLDVKNVMGEGPTLSARKTITNRDLEATARRRVASEQAYEKRTKELGLPSLEESRKQAEAASAIAQSELRERLGAERESEDYWRERAAAFRTEMSALDAEIRYIRAKLDEVPYSSWSGSFTTVSSIVPFISFGSAGGRGHFPRHRGQRSSVYTAPGATRGRGLINPGRVGRGRNRNRPGVGYWPGANLPLGGGLGLPNAPDFGSSQAYDYSYERSALITRFNDLAAARAGMNAQWRELEEEARRAGAPPGWLRR